MSSLQAGLTWPLSERIAMKMFYTVICRELLKNGVLICMPIGTGTRAWQDPFYATLAPEPKESKVLGKAAHGALQLKCRELLENGGFIHMPSVKVRARGKAAAGLSAGVKAGVMGGTLGKSPAHFGRCAPQLRIDLSLGGVHWQDFPKTFSLFIRVFATCPKRHQPICK